MLCESTTYEANWTENMASISNDPILSKALSISTCTNIFKCNDNSNKNNINVGQFVDFLRNESNTNSITQCMIRHIGCRYPINLKLSEKSSKPSKLAVKNADTDGDKKQDMDFYNQVTISFNDGTSTKSIKVFNNTTLHVTGCKSPMEARIIATFAWDLIGQVFPHVTTLVYKQNIHMLNATCEIGYSFNLRNLYSHLRRHIYVSYDPIDSKYPGAIAKYPVGQGEDGRQKHATIMLFASGNVAFSSNCLEHVIAAYNFFVHFAKMEQANIQSKEPILSKKKLEQTTKKRPYNLKGPRKNAKIQRATVI